MEPGERLAVGLVVVRARLIGSPRCGPNSETEAAAPEGACTTLIGDYAAPAVEVGQPTQPFRSGGVLLVRGRNIGTLIGRADRGCERGPQRVADRPRHRDDQRRWATNDNGPTVAVRMPPRRNLIEPVPGPFRPHLLDRVRRLRSARRALHRSVRGCGRTTPGRYSFSRAPRMGRGEGET